jgi:hypothetical protein
VGACALMPLARLVRAQNLEVFLQMAEGVDDETWSFHLAHGDISRWFREYINDDDLARAAEVIERATGLTPAASRARIKDAVEQRYTAPG